MLIILEDAHNLNWYEWPFFYNNYLLNFTNFYIIHWKIVIIDNIKLKIVTQIQVNIFLQQIFLSIYLKINEENPIYKLKNIYN